MRAEAIGPKRSGNEYPSEDTQNVRGKSTQYYHKPMARGMTRDKAIVLSRILERKDDILLMLSDQGEDNIDVLHAEDGKARSLIAEKVAVAIRPLQYTVVKPGGRKLERDDV